FAQAPWYSLPVHLCRFRVRSMWELFPGTPSQPSQSNKREQLTEFVTTHWLQNIDCIPIDYAFRPHLRDRLTLRRLTLRRNPYGSPFAGLQNVPLPRALACTPKASARGLSPVTFSARESLFRPVSCYAFFKGWLLLSQP